ncbi:THAP domain-containing protein 2-like [Pectinophora gossypiella]|uniref:THAP-type domain-containing protein n=1 Tax=Pectinophora gossypiella TaxID=13191 RepID=A0A1E1VYI8_PECGO|nr:THAP domain-containing protein 2-like [Pectinophora gossypiella]
MVTCAITSCKNTSAKISKNTHGITFHRFPKDKGRRRQWEVAVNREEQWTSTASSAVCSEHFEASDFYLTERGLRKLSCDAVPSINISACQPVEPTIADLEPVDIHPNDTEEVINLKYKVRRLEVLAESRRRKVQVLWQTKRRLRIRLARMKIILKHLISAKKDKVTEM